MSKRVDNKRKKSELEKKIKKAIPVVDIKTISKIPKKEIPKKEEAVEEFFVGLSESQDIRRNLLESSRDMIHTLQSYQKVREIRTEKLKRIEQFKTINEELKLLIGKLNKAMPKVQVKDAEIRAKETIEKKPRRELRIESSKTFGKSELEKLEDELTRIEARLSKLG